MSFFNLLIISTIISSTWCIIRMEDFGIPSYHLASSKISKKKIKGDLNVAEAGELRFKVNLFNDGKPFILCVRRRNSSVLTDSSVFLKTSMSPDANYNTVPMDFSKNVGLYEGFIEEFSDTSSVNGYVKDDNFYGHVIVNDSMFYIDELKEETIATEKNALIFKTNSTIFGILLNRTRAAELLYEELVKTNYFFKKFQTWKQKGRLCPMIVVIDYSFLNVVHKNNLEAAIFQIIFSLEESNAIFRSTDFDGDGVPDNIGFYVKKILVIIESKDIYFIPEYTDEEMVISDYLIKFMKFEELPFYCLGIIFTAQKFINGTLGASYTPDSSSLYPLSGICDRPIQKIGTLNGLVITTSTVRTPLVNQLMFEVTIAHELGHSFGTFHDLNSSCFGYLMSPKSFTDYRANRTHMIFSSCSREQILRNLVLKGDCFEPVESPFCGNGLIEEGEDCDCDLTRDCVDMDPCCVPRRTEEYPCKVNKKKGFECHPSQGECCTQECKYSTHLEHFVNCRHFDKSCPCPNNEKNCTCGIDGMCIDKNCHSIECVRLNLEECQCQPKPFAKFCQICCQYHNSCIPAIEATNKILKHKITVNNSLPIFNASAKKQYVSKKFCSAGQCETLQFSQGNIGEYCLHKGKLGKCQRDSQCEIFTPRQIFPMLETESRSGARSSNCVVNYYLVWLSFVVCYIKGRSVYFSEFYYPLGNF